MDRNLDHSRQYKETESEKRRIKSPQISEIQRKWRRGMVSDKMIGQRRAEEKLSFLK